MSIEETKPKMIGRIHKKLTEPNYDAIRAAAEKATKGKRKLIIQHSKPHGVRNGDGFICFMRKVFRYTDQKERYLQEMIEVDAEAELIALTDPDTIIAMCDALEAKNKEIEKWKTKLRQYQNVD